MPSLHCLFHFHCGQAAGSDEHVFPAALGGRRTDSRLICEDCQGWTSRLDEALSEQLRLLNLHLGVVGDHATKPARMPITSDTGHRILLDEKMRVEGRGKGLIAEETDEGGYTVRRYDFMSEEEERRALDQLQTQGLKLDLLNRTVTPILRTKPLTSGLRFGGTKALRASARIALNFLAIQEPSASREPTLEPFKRWILFGEPEGSEFIHFAGELPSPFRVSNHYEFGHRIIVGLDPEDGVFARVSFFNTFDLAVRLGTVVPGPRRYHVWDLEPTAPGQKPGVDRIERNLADILESSPRVLGDFAATSGEVYDKVQVGHDRILGPARARIDREHVERLRRQLSQLSMVPASRLPDRVRRLLRPELQCAANLVARAAPVLEDAIRAQGYDWTARYLNALIDSELAEFINPLSEGVLSELGDLLVGLVERADAGFEQVNDVMFGPSGLRVAYLALFRTLKGMRIWYKTGFPEAGIHSH
jgi:hypothetical protein